MEYNVRISNLEEVFNEIGQQEAKAEALIALGKNPNNK